MNDNVFHAAFRNAEPVISSEDAGERTVAMEWARRNCETSRYDHGVGRWYGFDGQRWRQDGLKRAFHECGALADRTLMMRGKKTSGVKASFVRGVETFAQADPRLAVMHDLWDRGSFLLGTPNGTVDLRTGLTIPADPAHYITKATSVAPESGEPTLWLRFLHEATGGDADLVRFLRQVLGYALTGDTREHALFFVYGVGKNGKSVFLNTAARILGDYAVTAAMDTFTASRGDRHPTELASLVGARLVTASETEEGRAWAEARIKQLTGGDKIAARFMRQDFFEFTPAFKLLIVGNHQPQLHNVDTATRRRFNIIPFTHIPARPDPQLEHKLAAEHGRILSWIIDGCMDWQQSGLVRPQVVTDATDSYFDAQDMLGQWIAERCEQCNSLFEQPATLFRDFSDFMRANGEDAGTAKSFGGNLEKRGFQRRKSNGIRAYRGIALRHRGDAE